MCLMIYLLGSVILLAYGGQCELTVDQVYIMLSARLDTQMLEQNIMKKEQDVMKKDIKDLMTSMTATNQQLSEVASFNQRLTSVQERLDNMDSHVKNLAAAEVGQRTHLLRRGLEKEKALTQSRLISVQKTLEKTQSDITGTANKTQAQISTVERNLAATQNNTNTLQSRVQSLDRNQADLNSKTKAIESQVDAKCGQIVKRIETLEKTQSDINGETNKTQAKIATLEQKEAAAQSNTHTLQTRFQSLRWTQVDLNSKIETLEKSQSDMKGEASKTHAQIATVDQKVVATQTNARSLQLRVQGLERTQADLNSKTMTIESLVDTTRGQISVLQQALGTFVGFSVEISTPNNTYSKNTIIKFDHIHNNEGNHYSPSTGIFTVPVSGVYVFMFNVQVSGDISDKDRMAHVVLAVDGKYIADAIVEGVAPNMTGGNAAVVKVLKGNRVYIQTAKWKENYYVYCCRTSFSGALLHMIS